MISALVGCAVELHGTVHQQEMSAMKGYVMMPWISALPNLLPMALRVMMDCFVHRLMNVRMASAEETVTPVQMMGCSVMVWSTVRKVPVRIYAALREIPVYRSHVMKLVISVWRAMSR
jgi:hypothetical protein